MERLSIIHDIDEDMLVHKGIGKINDKARLTAHFNVLNRVARETASSAHLARRGVV